MSGIFIQSTNITSPLGQTTQENYDQLLQGISGVRKVEDENIYNEAFQASMFEQYPLIDGFSKLESMFIRSIEDSLSKSTVEIDKKNCLFVLSTTKGNVDLLIDGEQLPDAATLHHMMHRIANHLGIGSNQVLISNACISGVAAISMAARLIESGRYEQAIVTGGDLVSEFVVSGFSSLMAISPDRCKPYDANRTGINMGEACATVILSKEESELEVLAGYTSNDANHISGPSRTGDGLFNAIDRTLKFHNVKSAEIDFINAHGTATSFNDEMESKAFKLAGLENVPMNSLKAFFGHTLGAAGLVESIISVTSMLQDQMIRSLGFDEPGTSVPLNVLKENTPKKQKTILKSASGFGGCNAAILFRKHEG